MTVPKQSRFAKRLNSTLWLILFAAVLAVVLRQQYQLGVLDAQVRGLQSNAFDSRHRDVTGPRKAGLDSAHIRDVIYQRDKQASVIGAMHPIVISLDREIETMRARANIPPSWPSNSDPLRVGDNMGAAVDNAARRRVLQLEAEIQELKVNGSHARSPDETTMLNLAY